MMTREEKLARTGEIIRENEDRQAQILARPHCLKCTWATKHVCRQPFIADMTIDKKGDVSYKNEVYFENARSEGGLCGVDGDLYQEKKAPPYFKRNKGAIVGTTVSIALIGVIATCMFAFGVMTVIQVMAAIALFCFVVILLTGGS